MISELLKRGICGFRCCNLCLPSLQTLLLYFFFYQKKLGECIRKKEADNKDLNLKVSTLKFDKSKILTPVVMDENDEDVLEDVMKFIEN